ncbi:tetratricopeptide repeat protein [Winogradskyella alexanderae]|uniref:Tetratricopeptide repeat protein n=1 Tax=Winogradskyella alexanderae TaxID=2877123 RepID=A0ABS7XT04_9FLAO|nr:tetratricopeptide repeat protein [Winogradskyella alexanderae]MCA0132599.1 tetratricopeptide repeat protein [Winogradskyella alexanderae]
MTTLKTLIKSLFFILALTCYGQNMQDGFTYLETGKYAKAETFFNTILKDYPNNKTARLCYGRAIGLNGKAEEAKILFSELLRDYPNDFEIKLNYGESLLWSNNFTQAEGYYKSLVTEAPNNFAALLGYANTLSNLKVYQDALIYVNKALEVLPGNANALTSKKYIYLGYAYQNQQAQNYDEAESLLIKNLGFFDDDKDTLLNLANLYIIWEKYDDAQETYKRLAEQPDYNTQALNGLALVAHLKGKENVALNLSSKAFAQLSNHTDSKVLQQTTERYVQALIWNKKYKQAENLIGNLMATQPNQNWVLALRATLNIYKSNFKQSLADYNQILVNDSTSFDGNLGKANALKALGRTDDALNSAKNTLKFYSNQKDAVNFINKINLNLSPSLESKASHTFDNGDNKAYALSANAIYPLSTKLRLLGTYNYRNTFNTITDNSATSHNVATGLTYELLPNLTAKGMVGLSTAQAETTDFTQLLTDLSLNIKIFKLQTLDIGYRRQVESFNADLLDRELVQNNYYANYNLSTNFNLGWYTQYIYTAQNDNNTRNLLFASLYYNLLAKPGLKVGFNYQYITFKDQVPTIYFSPEKFNAYEVFINLIKDEAIAKPKEWFYNVTTAFGYQYIEDDPKQTAYRLQGAFGYKFSERALLNLYGTHSNIASATAAGFTFTEVGIRLKWILTNKPIFKN